MAPPLKTMTTYPPATININSLREGVGPIQSFPHPWGGGGVDADNPLLSKQTQLQSIMNAIAMPYAEGIPLQHISGPSGSYNSLGLLFLGRGGGAIDVPFRAGNFTVTVSTV